MHLVSHDEIDGLNQACNAPETGLCRPSLANGRANQTTFSIPIIVCGDRVPVDELVKANASVVAGQDKQRLAWLYNSGRLRLLASRTRPAVMGEAVIRGPSGRPGRSDDRSDGSSGHRPG
jgi:hypothetical protein